MCTEASEAYYLLDHEFWEPGGIPLKLVTGPSKKEKPDST